MVHSQLQKQIETPAFTAALTRLYGPQKTAETHDRCRAVLEGFRKTFGGEAQALFSAPGRTEIGGNHTDHQHGRVLAAAVNLDILAAVSPNESGVLRIKSQGYPVITVDVRELDARPGEVGTSAALLRGVANRMAAMGCPLQGRGLDAYLTSTVPGGSGLSSSAAFEVLIGTMLNELFGSGRRTPVELAQIGQYAENQYFGKPCGLMDQLASSVGGVIAVDFADINAPEVTQLSLDLHAAGYALCILNSGAGHEDLTGEYAAITDELGAVCRTSLRRSRSFVRRPGTVPSTVRSTSMRKTAGCRPRSRRSGRAISTASCPLCGSPAVPPPCSCKISSPPAKPRRRS